MQSPAPEDTSPPQTPAPAAVDIRCLHCDYDLRGLPDDPVRCPECGRFTIRAEYVARTLNRETAGRYAAFAALLLCALLVPLSAAVVPSTSPCGLACAVPIALAWLASMLRVRREAGGSAGWFAMLVKHQVYVLLVMIAIPALLGASLLALIGIFRAIASSAPESKFLLVVDWLLIVLMIAAVLFGVSKLALLFGRQAVRCLSELNCCRPLRYRET